jgi:putative ABC transport system permease protein
MINDLRSAWRNMRHAPGMTGILVLTLALAIGANTAVFTVVNALLFDPLPYPHADRLVAVTFADEGEPLGRTHWPYPKYEAFARHATVAAGGSGSGSQVFDATAGHASRRLSVVLGDQPHRVEAEVVTAGYFELLGVTPAAGRLFHPDEDRTPGDAPVAIVSDHFRRAHFGQDDPLGQAITIRDRPYQIIGVLPPSFRGQSGTVQIWITANAAEHASGTGMVTSAASWWLQVIGRLKPGTSLAQAEAAMPALVPLVDADVLARIGPGEERYQFVPLKTMRISADVRQSFVLLLGAVLVVLLIACANAANLLLGRAVAREREFAVRLAIGAGRGTIVRQLAVESVALALVAATLGLVIAWGALDVLTTTRPANTSGFWAQYMRTFEYFDVSLDGRALAVNFAVAIGGGLLFGLAPAWRASRSDLNNVLKRGAGASSAGFGLRRMGARSALVLAEIALSIVLLVSAGLMIQSFTRATAADLGFTPDDVVTMTVGPSGRKPTVFYHDLLEHLEALPGVERAALSIATPMGASGWEGPVVVQGRPQDQQTVRGILNVVTPGFFSTYRIRVVQGRAFSEQDLSGPPVAVVSRALAERIWPGEDPLGRRVRYSLASKDWLEVVGVVDHVTYTTLEDAPVAMLYVPLWRPADPAATIFTAPTAISIRTAVGAEVVARDVRRVVQAADAAAPVFGVEAMTERASRVTARYRYSTLLMSGMAFVALLLAAIGTYGVLAYAVTSRTREIGIRMALGARPSDVLRLVLGGGLSLALAGIGLGLAGAFAATRVLGAVLFGVEATDTWTFAGVALLMAAVAAIASGVPAWRAARVAPVSALRGE